MQESLLRLFRESYSLRLSLLFRESSDLTADQESLRERGREEAQRLSSETGLPEALFLESLDRVLPSPPEPDEDE